LILCAAAALRCARLRTSLATTAKPRPCSTSSAEIWGLIALLALVTLVARGFFLVLPRRWQPRGRVEQALRCAPLAALLAALLAITVPEIVQQLPAAWQGPAPGWALVTDPRLMSALLLAAVIRLTRSTLWGLAAGSATYLSFLRSALRCTDADCHPRV